MAAPSTDEIYETTLQTQDIIATRLVEAPVRVEIDVSQRTVHGQASLDISTDEGKFNSDLIDGYLTPRRVSLFT